MREFGRKYRTALLALVVLGGTTVERLCEAANIHKRYANCIRQGVRLK